MFVMWLHTIFAMPLVCETFHFELNFVKIFTSIDYQLMERSTWLYSQCTILPSFKQLMDASNRCVPSFYYEENGFYPCTTVCLLLDRLPPSFCCLAPSVFHTTPIHISLNVSILNALNFIIRKNKSCLVPDNLCTKYFS